jgi:lysozyme family protein
MASFDDYMLSQPRYDLTQSSNDATINPRSDDAGNWTGCVIGRGNLVGTYRDWSACAETDYLRRNATVNDLRSLSFNDVKQRIKTTAWDRVGLDSVPDQDVANIVMHIRLHFGNISNVQRALNELGENLTIDGSAGVGSNTLNALIRQTRKNAVKTFNEIRDRLALVYSNSNPAYVNGFMRYLNTYFPRKMEVNQAVISIPVVLVTGMTAWYLYSKKNKQI